MNGVRFYLEHRGRNVFAAFVANGVFLSRGYPMMEGMGAVHDTPNSPVCGTSASVEWLRKKTTRISERRARFWHPELFARLDANS